MPESDDTGERLGTLPPCAICAGPGRGPRAPRHPGYGVSVSLCAHHRHPEVLARRAGRDLAASLLAVLGAAGCLTTARSRAKGAHLARLRAPQLERARPGSYSWPELRARHARGGGAGAIRSHHAPLVPGRALAGDRDPDRRRPRAAAAANRPERGIRGGP